MSGGLVARKGAAFPAATHAGDAARFHARRTIVLPAIHLHTAPAQPVAAGRPDGARPRRPARLTGGGGPARRKFTFRIDPVRHAAFCRAAEERKLSRQQLLTEALDALLARLEDGNAEHRCTPESGARMWTGGAAALPPPL